MNISEKTRDFLERRIVELNVKILKLKKKRKIIKTLYYSSIIISVTTSAVIVTLATMSSLPPLIVLILSTISAIMTALSTKFNLQSKKQEINNYIEKLDKIKHKLDYVISCNGNLTDEEYRQIISEFHL